DGVYFVLALAIEWWREARHSPRAQPRPKTLLLGGAMLTQTCIPGFDEATARDELLARVVENAGEDWRVAAMEVFRGIPGDELTGEDIRLACEAEGVRPHHHNAWGGFVGQLVREGSLLPTDQYRPMRAKGSHARKTQVYRRA